MVKDVHTEAIYDNTEQKQLSDSLHADFIVNCQDFGI